MKKSTVRKIVTIVVIVVLGIIFLSGCGLVTVLTYQWLSPARVATVSTPEGVTAVETNDVYTGGVTLGEETVCDYADGFNSRGQVVPSGTKVTGPASIKPDRDTNEGILLMPGAEYTTEATDEVIWLFVGDEACVNAQAESFSSVTTIEN